MSKKLGFTLEEHLEHAATIRLLKEKLEDLYFECHFNFPLNHKVVLSVNRARKYLVLARGRLDDEYHKVCGDEGFDKYGHIYYMPTMPKKPSSPQSPNDEGRVL
jgi:hypothetical protein